MKIKTIQLIGVALLLLFSCSSSKFTLAGKEYSLGGEFKGESLNFVNDSICFYTQTFYCDIPEKYRITEIKCSYTISRDTITLKRISCPEYLEGYGCYILSNSVFINCEPMFIDTTKHRLVIGAPPKIDRIGLVNNINEEENFLYYKGCIYYAKFLSCLPEDTIGSSFQVFCERGEKQSNRKAKNIKKLTKQRRIPINDLELALKR